MDRDFIERALRLARGGYADGGDAEVQSNGMPVISDGQVNWGDSSNAADFVRADQAMRAMRSSPAAPDPQAAPMPMQRRAPAPAPYSAPRDVPLPPVRPANLGQPVFQNSSPEGPGAYNPDDGFPARPPGQYADPAMLFDPDMMAKGFTPPLEAPSAPPPPAPPAPSTDELLALLSNPTQSVASAAIDQAAPVAKFTDRAAPGISMTPQQRDLIIRTIAAESSGKTPEEGQGIAHVIMNRIASGRYGKTPEKVLFAPKQFEPWADPRGSNYPMRHKPGTTKYEKAQDALEAAMGGDDITGGATLFWGPKAQAALGRPAPKWGRTGGLDIGDTRFHRDDGGMVEEREGHAGGKRVVDKALEMLRFKSGREIPIRPSTDDLYEVLSAQTNAGRAMPNTLIPIENMSGGVNLADPRQRARVDDLKAKMLGDDGHISRIIADHEGNVVEGQHRFEALRELGATHVPVEQFRDYGAMVDTPSYYDAIKNAQRIPSDNQNSIGAMALENYAEAGNLAAAREMWEAPRGFEPAYWGAMEEIERQIAAKAVPKYSGGLVEREAHGGGSRVIGNAANAVVEAALEALRGGRKIFPKPQRMFPEGARPPGGEYLDAATGEAITGQKPARAVIGVTPEGKPVFLADTQQVDVTGSPGPGSTKTKTNLFKQQAGWKWNEAPEGYGDASTLVSAENRGQHYYGLGADFPKGVDLERYANATSEPRLRPTTQGNVYLGQQVGSIDVRGREHPVYDMLTIRNLLAGTGAAGAGAAAMPDEREGHARGGYATQGGVDGQPSEEYSDGARPLTIYRNPNRAAPAGAMDVGGDQGPSYDQMGNVTSPGRNADPIVDAAMKAIPARSYAKDPELLAQEIQDYKRKVAEREATPEYYRQMTHYNISPPLAPVEIEGGFIGKRAIGEAPYDNAEARSKFFQTLYDMKTLPLYAAGSVFPPAAGLGMALDTAEGVAAGSPTQVAMGAFGAPGKVMKYGAAPLIAATGMLSPDEAQAAKLPKIGKAASGIAHAATPGGEMSLERAMEVAQKAASSPDLRASTRFPTGAKSIENPLTQQLTIGPAEMKASPGFEHNMNLLPEYPGFSHLRGLAPEDQLSGYIDQARGNLNFLYENAPDIMRQRSPLWYEGANNFSDALASRYGIPRQSSSAAIAALSPQMDWYKNASLAERVGDAIFSPTASRRMTPEMEAFQKSSEALTNDANQRVFDAIRGKRLSDLTDPLDQALWIRLYDEAHNPRNYRSLSPEGNIGDYIKSASGDPSKIGWGSLNEIAKAVRAYTSGGDMNVISPMLGTKHKVRSFYNNIELPNDLRFGDVTADTHAVAASQLRPLSGNTPAVAHNLASGLAKNKQPPGYLSEKSSAITGVQGTYGANAEATRLAAADQGLLPREMQSATWEPVRELFPAKWKNPKNVEAVDNIWRQKDAGNITAEQARNAILDLAGGFSQPSWSERGFTAIDPRKASTYR